MHQCQLTHLPLPCVLVCVTNYTFDVALGVCLPVGIALGVCVIVDIALGVCLLIDITLGYYVYLLGLPWENV